MLDSRRNISLACALSALAGYVDGIGFLHLGGLFVSFMSGNSTRMGVSLAVGHWSGAAEALGLIEYLVAARGEGSVFCLVRDLGEGIRVTDALRRETSLSPEELLAAWKVWAGL